MSLREVREGDPWVRPRPRPKSHVRVMDEFDLGFLIQDSGAFDVESSDIFMGGHGRDFDDLLSLGNW